MQPDQFRSIVHNHLSRKYKKICEMSKSMGPDEKNKKPIIENEIEVVEDKKDRNRQKVRTHLNENHPGAWINIINHPHPAGELSKLIIQFALNPQHELSNLPVPHGNTWNHLARLSKKINYLLKPRQKTVLDLGNSGNAWDLRMFLFKNQDKLGLKNIPSPVLEIQNMEEVDEIEENINDE